MTAPSGAGTRRSRALEIDVDGRPLLLTNVDKVLWPAAGFTKGDMIGYYLRVAEVLLPHIARRPLTLHRFPDGVEGLHWYQAQCRGRPPWLGTKPVPSVLVEGKVMDYCVVDDRASLVWVANQASIELHPFLATAETLDRPSFVVFDLDPGAPAGLAACCRVALLVRAILDELGLVGFPKTSGSKGLQLYVPLHTEVTYEQTKRFARLVAELLAGSHGDLVVARMDRSLRAGKVLIDWSQNDATKSTVAAYSLRARTRPTVSTPVTWDEVEAVAASGDAAALTFEVPDVFDRLDRHGDLFAPVTRLEQSLPA